jgi:hypothetical protein
MAVGARTGAGILGDRPATARTGGVAAILGGGGRGRPVSAPRERPGSDKTLAARVRAGTSVACIPHAAVAGACMVYAVPMRHVRMAMQPHMHGLAGLQHVAAAWRQHGPRDVGGAARIASRSCTHPAPPPGATARCTQPLLVLGVRPARAVATTARMR